MLAVSTLIVTRSQFETKTALANAQKNAAKLTDMLYASDMQVAYESWNQKRLNDVVRVLDRQIPKPGDEDRRGFEWNLLNSMTPRPQTFAQSGPQTRVHELAVFPDGHRVASVGEDGRLNVWSIRSGQLLWSIQADDRPIFAVAVSPDGKTIATGSDNVTLWSVDDRQRIGKLVEYDCNVESIAFSHDGERIAVGARYEDVRLFDKSGALIKQIPDGSRHESLDFSPKGQLLVPFRVPRKGYDHDIGVVRVYSNDGQTLEHEFDASGPTRFVPNYTLAKCSPDGSYYALAERYLAKVLLFDANSGDRLATLPQHTDQINAIAISADGHIVAAGYNDGAIKYWNVENLREEHPFSNGAAPSTSTFSLPGHIGAVTSLQFVDDSLISCGKDGSINRWQLGDRQTSIPAMPIEGGRAVAVSPDGTQFAIGGFKGWMQIRDVHASVSMLQPTDEINDVCYSADSKLLATCNRSLMVVELWDAKTGSSIRRLPHQKSPNCAVFSPTESMIATADSAGNVAFWDSRSGKKVGNVPLPGFVECCVFSPNGKRLYCGGSFDEVIVVDVSDQKIASRWPTVSYCGTIAIIRDGAAIATGHADNVIRWWNTKSGEKMHIFTGHERGVLALAFSPDGSVLTSAGHDGTVRLYSAATKQMFGVAHRHNAAIWGIAFSSDGNTLFGVGSKKEDKNSLIVLHGGR